MKGKRGQLTDIVQNEAMSRLGRPITGDELRLMAYVQYSVTNDKTIDRASHDEVILLERWKRAGWVVETRPVLEVTKTFWGALCELVWLAYVDIDL